MKVPTRFKDYLFKDFRRISQYEKNLVLKWRNHLSIRQWMDNKLIISKREHNKFLENLKKKKDTIYFLIIKKKTKVGVLTLKDFIDKKKVSTGFYISPYLKKRELALEVVFYSLFYCFNVLNFEKIHGYSEIKNKTANKLNQMLKIKLKTSNKYKNKLFGYLSKKTWKKKVENDKKIKKYLSYLN